MVQTHYQFFYTYDPTKIKPTSRKIVKHDFTDKFTFLKFRSMLRNSSVKPKIEPVYTQA